MVIKSSLDQYSNILRIQQQIFEYLPPKALKELLSSYDNDLDLLLDSMTDIIHNIANQDKIKVPNNFEFLPNFNQHLEDSLRMFSYNYFKATCLPEFDQYWRNIEWGNLIQLYNYLCIVASRTSGKTYEFDYAYPMWRMYRYRKQIWGKPNNRENQLNQRGVIITNELSLGKEILEKVVSEIKNNELLASVLNVNNKADLGKEAIVTSNGAKVSLRSFGSSARGLHPGWINVDDFLDVSAIYSQKQRDKFKEIFYAEISPALEPGGKLLVVGTPFSVTDLYNDLKNDKKFLVLEYPAIFPDGRMLAPDRLTINKLIDERESSGSIVFAREYLCKPISDSSTIFPWEHLNRAKDTSLTLVQNIESFGVKLDRVVIGCDFAISANIGADSSVFSVWGVKYGEVDRYYLIGLWKMTGATHNVQVSNIVAMNNRFKPNAVRAEDNGFQTVLISLAKERGVKNIEPFTTTSGNKKDLKTGLPSLAALFERGVMIIPYGDEQSRATADWLLGEFNSITFIEDTGKLESSGAHDDGVMSSFIAVTDLRENKSNFKYSTI